MSNLILSLTGDWFTGEINMRHLKFLNIHTRYFSGLLNLTHYSLSKLIKMLTSVHDLLKVDHSGQVTDNEKFFTLASGCSEYIYRNLVKRKILEQRLAFNRGHKIILFWCVGYPLLRSVV